MQASDFRAFAQMLALVAEQYGKSLTPELTRFYFEGLAHIELPAVRDALNRHVRNTDTGQFMPKVADIIRALAGTTTDAAYAGLVKLQNAFGSVGAYESPQFDDPIISAVVADMGGWPEVCARNAEEWQKFGAPEFMRRYRSIASRGVEIEAPLLAGIFDRTNTALGFGTAIGRIESKAPARIEHDKEAA